MFLIILGQYLAKIPWHLPIFVEASLGHEIRQIFKVGGDFIWVWRMAGQDFMGRGYGSNTT
jgi:hypothetical protein